MKISIITATCNSQNFIASCLDSISSQTYKNIEHIIVDGKSTDKTLEIINKHPFKPAKVVSEKDRGIYDALNKGIKNATGDIIGFLHSDDIFENEYVIEDLVRAFEKSDGDLVYGNILHVHQENTKKIFRTWSSLPFRKDLLKEGWMPPHNGLFVRRKIFLKHGVYNINFKIAADYEWILRVFSKDSVKATYIDKLILRQRIGGKSNGSLLKIVQVMIEDYKALRSNQNGLVESVKILTRKKLSKLDQFNLWPSK